MLSFKVDRISDDDKQGIGIFVEFTMIDGYSSALRALVNGESAPLWMQEVMVSGRWPANKGKIFVLGLPSGYAFFEGMVVDAFLGPIVQVPAPAPDPVYRGVSTISAFAEPNAQFLLLQAGRSIRFLEDNRIPSSKLSIGRGAVWFGHYQSPLHAGWQSFPISDEGMQAAQWGVVERTYVWRQRKAFGQSRVTGDIAWPAYSDLVNKALERDAMLSRVNVGFDRVIERMANFAHFEFAEDAFMWRQGFSWNDTDHSWHRIKKGGSSA